MGRPPKAHTPAPVAEEKEPELLEAAPATEPAAEEVAEAELAAPPVDEPAPVDAPAPPAVVAEDVDVDGYELPAVVLGWSEPLGVAGILTAIGYIAFHWQLFVNPDRPLSAVADGVLALVPILALAYSLLDSAAKRGVV